MKCCNFLSLVGVFAILGCSQQSSSDKSISWHVLNMYGLRLELVDSKEIEQLTFHEYGVNVSSGKRGGPVTGPAFNWRITDDGLEILDASGKLMDRKRLLRITHEGAWIVSTGDLKSHLYRIKWESTGPDYNPTKIHSMADFDFTKPPSSSGTRDEASGVTDGKEPKQLNKP